MNAFEREYAMALDRKENPQSGSYTNYLYEKGLEKILKKVGEESTGSCRGWPYPKARKN